MKSLKLKVNKKIYDRLLEILSQFSSEELIIVNKDSADKKYLQEKLSRIDEGKGDFFFLEELDVILEARIKKYEESADQSCLGEEDYMEMDMRRELYLKESEGNHTWEQVKDGLKRA